MGYLPLALLGLTAGTILFRAFLRAFIKYQYRRMLKGDEREHRRGLLAERDYLRGGFNVVEPAKVEPAKKRPPPPPRLPEASETIGVAPEPEIEPIYEFGTEGPVAWVRVAEGAQVEQMVCAECYMGLDWRPVAKVREAGGLPDLPPADAPKCANCNGKGRYPVTRIPF